MAPLDRRAGMLMITALLASVLSGASRMTGAEPAAATSAANPFRRAKLRFRPDRTFKILLITDIHYGEDGHLDALTDQAQAAVLAAEQPDLVMFGGDMVSGWVCSPSRSPRPAACGPGWFEARWRQLIAPVHAAGLPYAVILGNHDAEAELSRREILDLDIRTGGLFSFTRQGPPEATGASNYFLDVHAPDASGPAARLWLLDSLDRTCPPLMFGWGCVAPDTLRWLRAAAARLPPVPSLAFVHIPVPQFMEAWARVPTVGARQEDVACSARDTGLFELARELGIHAIYSGHDHNNEFVGVLDGVRLAYGRKTGHGGYGPPQGWLLGARVIELRMGEDTAASATWIRQEDGSVVAQQPSPQPKDLHQLVCHSDEFGRAARQQQGEVRQGVQRAGVTAAAAGAQASTDQ